MALHLSGVCGENEGGLTRGTLSGVPNGRGREVEYLRGYDPGQVELPSMVTNLPPMSLLGQCCRPKTGFLERVGGAMSAHRAITPRAGTTKEDGAES